MLYDSLTSDEHLTLFGRFKGVSKDDLVSEIPSLLESVKLSDVAHKPSGAYSGGMKRRLSVAVSYVGSPKVVFLDEPTTYQREETTP